jgi:cyclophilin family peptidyl-prolyl cis-trans isomerase
MPAGSISSFERWLAAIASVITVFVFVTGTTFVRECAKDHRVATPTTTTTDTVETTSAPTHGRLTDNVIADIETSSGIISLKFFPDIAPNHVRNFIQLAESGFYDGTKFHAVIPGLGIFGGDPNTIAGPPSTWGIGGSGPTLEPELGSVSHQRGILYNPSTSSQFFICVADLSWLDQTYTAFGEVTAGMNVVDNIAKAPRGANDRPRDPVIIRHVTVRSSQ